MNYIFHKLFDNTKSFEFQLQGEFLFKTDCKFIFLVFFKELLLQLRG
jgi:hypothetical protein